MSDYIPDDLWPKILQNSTPDTLLRCRCVCKSWRSLISSPSFIASNLSSQQPRLIAREPPSLHGDPRESYVLFRPQFQSLPSPVLNLRFRAAPDPNLHIIGTANGLLCLADDSLGIALWNPLIRRCVYPPTPIYFSPAVGYTSTLGFGFDPRSQDFKIVRIARCNGGLFTRRSRFPLNAEVFSVGEWKWRPIDDRALRDLYTFPNRWSQCLLNGASHWAAHLRSARVLLLSFDFGTEEFKMIELPQELQRTHVRVSKAGDLLSVLDFKHAGACDVWAMREYGEASSWCKMASVRWEGGHLRDVMWVREDFGEMIVSGENEEVFRYDPWNRDVKSVGFRCKGDGCFTDGFVGSLVLMDAQDMGDSKQIKAVSK